MTEHIFPQAEQLEEGNSDRRELEGEVLIIKMFTIFIINSSPSSHSLESLVSSWSIDHHFRLCQWYQPSYWIQRPLTIFF